MPRLFIDASWPTPAVGVWENGRWRAFAMSDTGPVESLFDLVEHALDEAGLTLSELSGYIYAEGPGSVLGLRTAAMALRTWARTPGLPRKPIAAVNSLALAAALAATENPGLADTFTVFAAARRDRWNAYTPGDKAWAECDAAALAVRRGPFLKLPSRDFATTPVPFTAYDPAAALMRHPEVLSTPGLRRPTEAPDAANTANTYVAWTGERHRV